MAQAIWFMFLSAIVLCQGFASANRNALRNVLYNPDLQWIYVIGNNSVYIIENSTLHLNATTREILLEDYGMINSTTVPDEYNAQFLYNDTLILLRRDDAQINHTILQISESISNYSQTYDAATDGSEGLAFIVKDAVFRYIPPSTGFDETEVELVIDQGNIKKYVYSGANITYFKAGISLQEDNSKGIFLATDDQGVAKLVLIDSNESSTTEYNLTCGNEDKNIANGHLLHATVIENIEHTSRYFLTIFRTPDYSQLLCFYSDETISNQTDSRTVAATRYVTILGHFDVTSLSGVYLSSIDDLVVYIGTATGQIYWSHVLRNEKSVNLETHPLHSNGNTKINKLLVTNHNLVALTDMQVLAHREECKGDNWENCSKQTGFMCGWNITNNICTKLTENVNFKNWIPSQRMNIYRYKYGIRMGSQPKGKVNLKSPYFNHSNSNLSCRYLNEIYENCSYPNVTNDKGQINVTVDFFTNENQQVGQTVLPYYNCSALKGNACTNIANCTYLTCAEQCVDKKADPETPACTDVCQYVKHGYVWSGAKCLNKTNDQGLTQSCDRPVICKVTPNKTTLDGKETITLYGENFGHFINESLSIFLAGVECTLIQPSDISLNILQCQAGIANEPVSGPVNITIGNRVSDSTQKFTYKEVKDSGLVFTMGPVAGGTKLSLSGEDLDVAEKGDVAVMINQQYNCHVTNVTSDQINCTTGPGEEGQHLPMSVTYRNITVNLNSTFTYRPNPRIDYIEPNVTFSSGGINITLNGMEFDAIQRPEIALSNSGQFFECTGIKTNNTLVCPSPPSPIRNGNDSPAKGFEAGPSREKRQARKPNTIQVRMDGVVLQSNLTYVEDPIFHNFTEEGQIKELGFGEDLEIMGKRLNAAARAYDYTITIGAEKCRLYAEITDTTLTCMPPPEKPTPVHSASAEPEVEVRLGNLVQRVGYLRYKPRDQTVHIIIGVLVCVAIVTLVVSVVLARYFIKKNKTKMNEKMDRMELDIREQCREVFAEVQTDMTDVTEELVAVGIPFQSFHIYVLQFIFPSFETKHLETHVALTELQEHEGTKEDLEASMILLDQLVNNKFFLVSVIKTLDNQNYRKLPVKKRTEIAAYISLLLMNEMEYFTELIETLLQKQGYVYKNPKDLFKRCETITEKIVLNWFAMCMYNPLKKHAGSALYILHKAVESVSQKFAIDAITGKARATLSPHHLLALDFEPDIIKLTVQINNGRFETSCQVLDCDTITQVKTKCLNSAYKRETASERPGADEIDIEWRITADMGKLLYDEDSSSVVSNGYRKLNTVRHYGITNGSVICLLSKERECTECDYMNSGSVVSLNETRILIQSEDTESKMNASPPLLKDLPTLHLVHENDSRASMRAIPEINYQKHLQTKMSLKKFIDDMVDNTVRIEEVPYPVRFLFSQLDKIGQSKGVESSTVESWKKQSYGIRFWTRLLARPDILFDLNKSSEKYVQPNMNIITLAYNDSYSPPQDLGKNSLTEKLLFYKDCMAYREKINKFFSSRTTSAPVSMEIFFQELESLPSTLASVVINRQSVLYQFYTTIDCFITPIRAGLVETTETDRLQLSLKLDEVFKRLRNS